MWDVNGRNAPTGQVYGKVEQVQKGEEKGEVCNRVMMLRGEGNGEEEL